MIHPEIYLVFRLHHFQIEIKCLTGRQMPKGHVKHPRAIIVTTRSLLCILVKFPSAESSSADAGNICQFFLFSLAQKIKSCADRAYEEVGGPSF